jgi:hypothetical protein
MYTKKYFYLPNFDGRQHQRMTANDLIEMGISRSTAYRAIQRGTIPRHRLRDLQFRIFGELTDWEGWQILPHKIIQPNGQTLEPRDIENLSYLKKILWDWDI